MDAKELAGLTDTELLVYAVREITMIAGAELDASSAADRELVNRLLDIIDRGDVVAALDRLEKKYGMKPLSKSE